MILDGHSLNNVADTWNSTELRSTRGCGWNGSTVRNVLRSPRIAGDRAWHGTEVVATDCFPAILDRLTAARVRSVLAARAGELSTVHHRFLLGGLLTCGRCGCQMYGASADGGRYICHRRPGCGRVGVKSVPVDKILTDEFLGLAAVADDVSDEEAAALASAVVDRAERLEQLNSDYYAARLLTRPQFLAARSAILADSTRQLAARPGADGPGLPLDLALTEAVTAWPKFDILQRRSLIASQLASAVVSPAARMGCRFDSSRLTIEWHAVSRLSLP
jgi:hypothetical protein